MKPNTSKPADKAPISTHPAFPAIVALWFCALFGIGSMVLPTALLEKIVTATGLAAVIPSAAPPLGATARILIALAASGVGVVAGLYIARKVVASQANGSADTRRTARTASTYTPASDLSAKRPISAHEELGSDRFDAPLDESEPALADAGGRRRRALSLSDESVRSEFLDLAPLPGQFDAEPALATAAAAIPDPQDALDLAAFGEDIDEAGESDWFAGHPETTFAEFTASEAMPPVDPQPIEEPGIIEGEDDMPMTAANMPAPFDAPEGRQDFVASAPEPHTPDNGADFALDRLSIAGLVDRFARALESHRAAVAEQATVAVPVAQSEPEPAAEPDLPVAIAPPPEQRAPFAPVIEPPAAPVPDYSATPAPPPPYVPAALRPVAVDEERYDDEELPDLDLTAAFPTRSRPASDEHAPAAPNFTETVGEIPGGEESGEDFGQEVEDDGYPSLLAMRNPFGLPREAVRIDDDSDEEDDGAIEPAVVFPGQGERRAQPAPDGPARDIGPASAAVTAAQFRPFDSPEQRIKLAESAPNSNIESVPAARRENIAETERRLREALEKLQKMSGAA